MGARRMWFGAFLPLIVIMVSCGGTMGGGGGNPTVVSVSASVTKTSLNIGDATHATCTVFMSDGTSNGACSLKSANPAVVTVNATTGLVSAIAAGSADISATANADSTKSSNKVTVTVTVAVTITSVAVSAKPGLITTAQTSACTAVVSGTGAFNDKVTWTAAGGTLSNVADTSATFTPAGPGTGSCKATSVEDASQSGSASITITQAAPHVSGISAPIVYAYAPGDVTFVITGSNFITTDVVTVSAPGQILSRTVSDATHIQVTFNLDSAHLSPGWFRFKVCDSTETTCSNAVAMAIIGDQNTLAVGPNGELFENDQAQGSSLANGYLRKFKIANGAAVADGSIGPAVIPSFAIDGQTGDIVGDKATLNSDGTVLAVAKDDGNGDAYIGQAAVSGRSAYTRPFGNPDANLLSVFAVNVDGTPLSSIRLGVEPWTVGAGTFRGVTHAYAYSRNGTPTLWDVDASNANLLGSVEMPFTPYATLETSSLNGGWEIAVFSKAGPAQGTIAVLSNFDRILVFVDRSTEKVIGQITLDGNPFRIAADETHGKVIVAFADFTDQAHPKGTYASVAPAASPTLQPLTSTSANLPVGLVVSADGASLYACERASCEVLPNQ